ncbi:MAG: response regulator transcription factor [Hyphomicrobiaceae bacterium]
MRFLIIDDHALFRRGLKTFLGQSFPEADIDEADSLEAGLSQASALPGYDIIFLDLIMPGGTQLEGLRKARDLGLSGQIAVMSALEETELVLTALEAGARAYIPKSAPEEVVRHAVALLLAGEAYIPSQVLKSMRREPASPSDQAPVGGDGPLGSLTRRQRQTLMLLIEGLSNKEIARQLGLLESTVKAHIKVILAKLNAQNRTQAALIAAKALGRPG